MRGIYRVLNGLSAFRAHYEAETGTAGLERTKKKKRPFALSRPGVEHCQPGIVTRRCISAKRHCAFVKPAVRQLIQKDCRS